VVKETWMRQLGAYLLVAIILGPLAAGQAISGQAPETQAPAGQAAPSTPPYQPKFAGDPARSESEAQALGYMRVVLRAQKEYKKRHDKFAPSLPALAGTGSLTKRMANTTDRGDYTVGFKAQKDGFVLTMTPKQMDATHRSFYAEEDGGIRGDDQKAADATSPRVK
jgi:hypothetical protein